MKIKSSITQFNIERITSKTGNIYKSVKIIGKRARQLSTVQKEELNEKLAEFASDIDNLEEIFENKEQIEISRYFERLPKSSTVAAEELINDELFFRDPEDKDDSISNEQKLFIDLIMKIYIFFFIYLLTNCAYSQELKTKVLVNTEQLQSSESYIFEELRNNIEQFLNNQIWTNDKYLNEEKIIRKKIKNDHLVVIHNTIKKN